MVNNQYNSGKNDTVKEPVNKSLAEITELVNRQTKLIDVLHNRVTQLERENKRRKNEISQAAHTQLTKE